MDRETVWESEKQFFDEEHYSEDPIPQATVDRYCQLKKPWLPAEMGFALIGDVRGKRVLELGCGGGGNSVLLALRGAQVVGIDISSKAIEAARKVAAHHGVQDRATFICSPLELVDFQDKFDVICGWALLHHIIPVIDETLARLKQHAHPGTVFLFVEPVALSRALRRLRLMLPIATHGTEDERPLESAELDLVRRHFGCVEMHWSGAGLRLVDRFWGGCYEDLSPLGTRLYDACASLDRFLLNTVALHSLASSVTIRARQR